MLLSHLKVKKISGSNNANWRFVMDYRIRKMNYIPPFWLKSTYQMPTSVSSNSEAHSKTTLISSELSSPKTEPASSSSSSQSFTIDGKNSTSVVKKCTCAPGQISTSNSSTKCVSATTIKQFGNQSNQVGLSLRILSFGLVLSSFKFFWTFQ